MDYNDELKQLKIIINEKLYEKEMYTFLDEADLECDYSHQEISEIHENFIREAKNWIHENYPNKFALYSDWCIHLITAEFVRNKHPMLERYIIL